MLRDGWMRFSCPNMEEGSNLRETSILTFKNFRRTHTDFRKLQSNSYIN